MVNLAPCKGCDRRYVGCHDTCEDYKKSCEEREKIKRANKEATRLYWADVRRTARSG